MLVFMLLGRVARQHRQSVRGPIGLVRRRTLVALAGARSHLAGQGIALTYDDGPHGDSTPALLDVLAEAGVQATFFVRGDAAVRRPDLVRRMLNDGHAIGSHSMTHPDFRRQPFATVRSDVARSRAELQGITGASISLIRPPHGRLTLRTAWYLRRAGWTTWLWDIDAYDWKSALSAQDVVANVSAAQSGDVVLLHDTDSRAAAITQASIRTLKEQGAHFVTLGAATQ